MVATASSALDATSWSGVGRRDTTLHMASDIQSEPQIVILAAGCGRPATVPGLMLQALKGLVLTALWSVGGGVSGSDSTAADPGGLV